MKDTQPKRGICWKELFCIIRLYFSFCCHLGWALRLLKPFAYTISKEWNKNGFGWKDNAADLSIRFLLLINSMKNHYLLLLFESECPPPGRRTTTSTQCAIRCVMIVWFIFLRWRIKSRYQWMNKSVGQFDCCSLSQSRRQWKLIIPISIQNRRAISWNNQSTEK